MHMYACRSLSLKQLCITELYIWFWIAERCMVPSLSVHDQYHNKPEMVASRQLIIIIIDMAGIKYW